MIDIHRTAYHEAGHALVAWTLGYSVVLAKLTPDDPDSDGVVSVIGVRNDLEGAMCSVAGMVAETLAEARGLVPPDDYCVFETPDGTLDPDMWTDSEDPEWEAAYDSVRGQTNCDSTWRVHPQVRAGFKVAHAWLRSKQILTYRWPDVEKLAARLFQTHLVEFDELMTMFEKASNPDHWYRRILRASPSRRAGPLSLVQSRV